MFFFAYFKLLFSLIEFILIVYLAFLCGNILTFTYRNSHDIHELNQKLDVSGNLLIIHVPFILWWHPFKWNDDLCGCTNSEAQVGSILTDFVINTGELVNKTYSISAINRLQFQSSSDSADAALVGPEHNPPHNPQTVTSLHRLWEEFSNQVLNQVHPCC